MKPIGVFLITYITHNFAIYRQIALQTKREKELIGNFVSVFGNPSIIFIIKLIEKQREGMSHLSNSPKLLFEFYKNQKVPKLVKKRPETNHPVFKNNHQNQYPSSQKKSLTNSLLEGYFHKPSATKEASFDRKIQMENAQSTHLYRQDTNQPINPAFTRHIQQTNIFTRDRANSHSHSLSPPIAHQPAIQEFVPRRLTFEQRKYEEQIFVIENLTKENDELRLLTQQLIQKQRQMRAINNELQDRIVELENLNQEFIKEQSSQKTYLNYEKKVRNKVYQQLSYYIQDAVSQFTEKMSKQKMSPLVQDHIQNFLQLILNLNDVTVSRNHYRNSNNSKLNIESVDGTINEIIQKSKEKRNIKSSKTKNRDTSVSPMQKYENVFEKLNNMSPESYAQKGYMPVYSQISKNVGRNTVHNENEEQMRGRSGQSPSGSRKRIKIFNKNYAQNTSIQHLKEREGGRVVRNLFTSTNNRTYL